MPGKYSEDATGCDESKCDDGNTCYQGQERTCPDGFYCQTSEAEPYPKACGIGFYLDNASGPGTQEADCVSCDGGSACLVKGSHEVDAKAKCGAGYACRTESTSTTPTAYCPTFPDGDLTTCTGYICPQGYFCEEETTTPALCPDGTFSNSYGLRSSDECIDCIEGYQCTGIATRSACDPGYYCPAKTVA